MNTDSPLLEGLDPILDKRVETLILGSFPSVKSREAAFFYGHPQNRFWRVTAAIFGAKTPETIPEKKRFLLQNGIALWDVIASCDIEGSADTSIKNVTPNDLSFLLNTCDIKKIFTNGKAAHKLYNQYLLPQTAREAIYLPSTSPANAAFSLEKLIEQWKAILI